jgi:catechol 2,3-dioxygenase-like lactoylglutathione lyase family enzyme
MTHKGFSHIGLSTLDLDKTRAFYEGVLGFEPVGADTITIEEGGHLRHMFFDVRDVLPDGYRFDIDPDAVAHAVLGKSIWAVLALTLDIELFTQLHYRRSIDPDAELSELFKDVFLYHWKEEMQHAILDELEWVRHDAGLTAEKRDVAVDEFIELVAAVDGILQAQATADAGYFAATCSRAVGQAEAGAVEAAFLKAYRWQYIHSGAQHPYFGKVLSSPITKNQGGRIQAALATLQ